MLIAARDAKVKRFVFASSSSVYGSSQKLPKVEEEIGEPLSPYAVTKLVNEKYARVFTEIYGLETIGLRYFNVFGRRQDPDGAYAAVIPKWVVADDEARKACHQRRWQLSQGILPILIMWCMRMRVGSRSRQSAVARSRQSAVVSVSRVECCDIYNVAFGANTTLNELFSILRDNLSTLRS